MLTQMMVIGVGGSGGKTLRVLRQALLRRLREAGWTKSDLPDAWQLLWIDTKSVQTADGSPLPLLPADDYFGATAAMADYDGIRNALIGSLANPANLLDALAWMPQYSPVNIEAGAGQYRAIGRAVGLNRLAGTREALERQYRKMISPQAQTELVEVARLLGADVNTPPPAATAIVISSLAGGSGAGMYMDVIEALKTLGPDMANTTHTILYGPDVFDSIDPGQRVRIPVNTLAGMSEVLAGVWANGVTNGTAAMYGTKSIPDAKGPGIGGRYTYLIGASNGQVAFSDADDVYQAVGNALVAMVADESVQDWLTTFVLMAVFAASGGSNGMPDATELKVNTDVMQRQPVASLGFSRLSLGTDRLAEYISEAGGKEVVRRLLWPAFDADPSFQGGQVAQVKEMVDTRWPTFLRQSGVNELNPANDVIDQLRAPDSDERFRAFVTQTKQSFRGAGSMSADAWLDLIFREWENNYQEIMNAEIEAQYHCARDWVNLIQHSFLDHISRSLVDKGLLVTEALLDRLRDHLATTGIPQLRLEASEARAQLDLMYGTVSDWLAQVGNTALDEDDPILQDSIGYFLTYLNHLADANRFDLAADLLTDFQENVLEALRKTLRNGHSSLQANVEARLVDGDRNPFEGLADLRKDTVPVRLQPAMTERLLIPVGSFPAEMDRLIKGSVEQGQTGRATERFLESCMLGTALDARGEPGGAESAPRLLTVEANWIPKDERARGSLRDNPQPLKTSIPVFPMQYVERVRDELTEDSVTLLGTYLAMGIEDYLAMGAPHEQQEKETTFKAELAAVIGAGAPMSNINISLGQVVHPGHNFKTAVTSSVVPAALQPLVDPVIQTSGMGNAKVRYANVKVTEITFFQIDEKAMSPVVLDSFMKGIAQSWAAASPDPTSRATWWGEYARARPLTESIPVAPEVLNSMITGWFTALSLGLVRTSTPQENLGLHCEIWDTTSGTWNAFPYPLLSIGLNPQQHEVLPAVLKSIAIALVDVNNRSSLEPLDAYKSLRKLGENHAAVLTTWVEEGRLLGQSGGPIPASAFAGSAADDAAERKRKLVETIEETAAFLNESQLAWEREANPFSTPKMWELRALTEHSLNEIHRTLNNLAGVSRRGLFGAADQSVE